MSIFTLWIVLLGSIQASLATGLEGQQQVSPSPAECAVYSVVLDSLYREVAASAFLVNDSTVHPESLHWGADSGADLISEALKRSARLPDGLGDGFRTRNAQPATLSSCVFHTSKPVVILGHSEFQQIAEKTRDLDEYPGRYPARGTATFSRVGFTPDQQNALVYEQFHCGGRCGSGQVVILAKHDGRWVIQRTMPVVTF